MSSDMVSRKVFEQVMWERDVAINQLKELGYGLGEKIRTDDDAISRQAYIKRFKKWGYSEFGRKMDNEELAIRVAMSLPSVNPQEPIDYKAQYESFAKKAEIVISQLRADRDRLADVFDKIRAEIEQTAKDYDKFDDYRRVRGLWIALEIIDKYKAECEG